LVSVRRLLAEQGGELRLVNDADGGGVATAIFSSGTGLSPLTRGLDGWRSVLPEARRALRAAHGLLEAGDEAAARHLWSAGLSLEVTTLLAGVEQHQLLARLERLASGSAKSLQLTARGRLELVQAFGEGAWPRAEAAARRVLGRIAQRRLKAESIDLADAAVLVLLFAAVPAAGADAARPSGLPADPVLARNLAVLLFEAAGGLAVEEGDSRSLERQVLETAAAIAKAGCRPVTAG
jgi:hypothetical protein